MALHKDLPDSELHEPKGVASASAGTVYIADGSGSGSWSTPLSKQVLQAAIVDISNAGTYYTVAAYPGTLKKIYLVLHGAVTTANSVVSFTINGVPITNSGITVDHTTSGAGVVYSSTPTAANLVTAGSVISVTTDGGSSTTVRATITYEIEG